MGRERKSQCSCGVSSGGKRSTAVSRVTGLRLLDLDLPPAYAAGFAGPGFGIDGTRKLAGVFERPIIGTIVKPSIGLTPVETAELVNSLCAAGIDFIKDDEADLARHLAAQTAQPIAKFTWPNFAADRQVMDAELAELISNMHGAVLFDGATPTHLTEVGRLIEGLSRLRSRPLFCVGSSGLEYALTQWWRESASETAPARNRSDRCERHDGHDLDTFDAVPQLLAVSGSASPLSALQIDAALAAGFADLPVDAAALVAEAGWQGKLAAVAEHAIKALPADIANACLFLASDQSAYITGVVLDVSGGLHIH